MTIGWEEKRLLDIAELNTGKWDANHSVKDGKYKFFTCAFEPLLCNTKRFSGDCLVLPGNGVNVGEVFFYSGDFDAYQRTYVLSNIKINSRFLHFHMLSNWRNIGAKKQFGSATNFIKLENFKNYIVSFPPLPDQQKIVERLDAAFELIDRAKANIEQNIQNAKELFQSKLNEVFSQKDEGWEEKFIKEVADFKSGTTLSPLLEKNKGDIAYLKVADMNLVGNSDGYVKHSSRYINIGDISLKNIIPAESIIFPKRGGAILTDKKRFTTVETAVDLNIMASIPRITLIISKLLYYFFLSFRLNDIANGTTILQINNYSFDNVKINIPKSLETQQKIVDQLDQLSAQTELLQQKYRQKLENLEELRKSVLEKAFKGELV